jgi:hypothetical protein
MDKTIKVTVTFKNVPPHITEQDLLHYLRFETHCHGHASIDSQKHEDIDRLEKISW